MKGLSMKLLVVEDDVVTGTLLKKVLSKEGYDVTHVNNGGDALAAVQSAAYRIILTDWVMPEMDGLTLCRHIRVLDLSRYIYIILVTAKNSKKDAVSGLEAGADDYIIKPFDNLELKARIRAGRRLVDLEDTNRDTLHKLARSEKLAAVGHLAAGVAHEINNPIGFINSNLNSLNKYIDDLKHVIEGFRRLAQTFDPSIAETKINPNMLTLHQQLIQLEKKYDLDFLMEDVGDLIADCSDGTSRIQNIVHEMRYFAHPEKQSIEHTSLNEILKNAVDHITDRLPAGVSLENHATDLPVIECNTPHIEQALVNLLQNALDAVGSKEMITIDSHITSDTIELRIIDHGHGIAPENLSKVFDPFFTTKPVGQGVGLGLTTAQNIIRMHDGIIDVRSKPDESTTFTVVLPLPAHA
jgi:signal transduction histidine kinase